MHVHTFAHNPHRVSTVLLLTSLFPLCGLCHSFFSKSSPSFSVSPTLFSPVPSAHEAEASHSVSFSSLSSFQVSGLSLTSPSSFHPSSSSCQLCPSFPISQFCGEAQLTPVWVSEGTQELGWQVVKMAIPMISSASNDFILPCPKRTI